MNYKLHYDRLISRASGRTIAGYKERHHVLPRCVGGGDEPENIVELTAEEHYVAHQLLVRMHSRNKALVFAARSMSMSGPTNQRLNNKLFGWIRRRCVAAMRGIPLAQATKDKLSIARKGIPLNISDAGRKRIGDASRKRVYTPAMRAQRSAVAKLSRTGSTIPADVRAKISASQRGRIRPPEIVAKISASQKGRVFSDAHRAKISAAMRGNRNAVGGALDMPA